MTTDAINPKTTHSKLRLVGLLMATALVATACGGGGGGDAAPPAGSPPAGSPPAGSPPAASDVVTLADIKACPVLADSTESTVWYTCLVGKRFVGKDPFTNQSCQLSFKTGGVFEYAKNGAIVSTTRPIAQWSNPFGLYRNADLGSGSQSWFFLSSLKGEYKVVGQLGIPYQIELNIKNSTLSSDAALNDDSFTFKLENNSIETCKLDI